MKVIGNILSSLLPFFQGLPGNNGPQGQQGPPGPIVCVLYIHHPSQIIQANTSFCFPSTYSSSISALFYYVALSFRESQEHLELQDQVGRQGPRGIKDFL